MPHIESLGSALSSVHTALYAAQRRAHAEAASRSPAPFVTISRQVGARGITLARALADRLNARGVRPTPWTVWDRELIEKVVAEEGIPETLVESLEGPPRPWLVGFFAGLAQSDVDRIKVYHKVARTIRGLASAGRAIIVGRGGVYATTDLPGGVHIRLVAPFENRVAHMAQLKNLPMNRAAAEVRRLDHERDTFHRRFGHKYALLPEAFTITLNVADMSDEQMVECILPLIPTVEPAPSVGEKTETLEHA